MRDLNRNVSLFVLGQELLRTWRILELQLPVNANSDSGEVADFEESKDCR
jgi:hypothetical protein